MRVLLLSPIASSLYSRVLAQLSSSEPGMQIVGAVVRRPWSWNRITGELRRDGPRLLNKVYQKMILGDAAHLQSEQTTLLSVARAAGLNAKSLHQLAKQHDFPCITVGDHNDESSLRFIRDAAPDAIAFTGGGLIRRELLALPKLGVLNCHMGLLPKFRGMDVVEWPLLEPSEGKPPLGLTVHFMDSGVDTGPILKSEPLQLQPQDNFLRIRERLTARMPTLMLEVLRSLRDGSAVPQQQQISDGKQFYVMHPRITALAQERLRNVLK